MTIIKRVLLAVAMFAACTSVYAHDCSSASDCARVIHCSGVLAALLGLFIGTAAAATPDQKEDPCRLAKVLRGSLLATMVITAALALAAAAAALLFAFPLTAFLGLGLAMLVALIAFLYIMYRLAAEKCGKQPVG